MADVVAFPLVASRTARKGHVPVRADGGTRQNVVVFTGVWHERVNNTKSVKDAKKPAGRGK